MPLNDAHHHCKYDRHHLTCQTTVEMKVTRQQAAENRERILDAASKLFRERGLDGIGVADLMKGAGLTHGGFYGHFSSKEELMAQACTRALEASVDKWRSRGLREIVQSYLSS